MGPRSVHRDPVHAVTNFGVRIGDMLRSEPAVDCRPRRAAIVSPENPGGRDGDEDSLVIRGINEDGVETQTARARRPPWTGPVPPEARELSPVLAAIFRLEQRRVFDPRIDHVGIGERWL